MAGEAKDDPEPLIGAGVVFACSARVASCEFLATFVVVGVTVVPGVVVTAPGAVVVVLAVPKVVVVLVDGSSAPAGRVAAETEAVASNPAPSNIRPQAETRVVRTARIDLRAIRILIDSFSMFAR